VHFRGGSAGLVCSLWLIHLKTAVAAAAKTLLSKIGAALPPRSLNPTGTPVRALGKGLNDQSLRYWNGLYRAIQQKQTIRIAYLSLSEAMSERVVFPLGLFYWGGKWTVGTWCQLRNSYRDFRVDRIKSLNFVLGVEFPAEISLEAYTSFNLERIKLSGFN